MNSYIPFRAILEEDIDIVLSFRKIKELYNVLMVDGFPCFNLAFECIDEVVLR
jgi:hypothetical protein